MTLTSKKIEQNGGFSLVELALGMLMLGLIMGPILAAYTAERKSHIIYFNLSQFTTITDNTNDYVTGQATPHYPLPASLLASPGDADYGKEVAGAIADCSTWPTPNGVCRTSGPDPVLIGAVPFGALGINPDFTYDFWNYKLLYAVTESQTGTYVPGEGKIQTSGYREDRTIGMIDNDIDMVLISHGESAQGAYTQSGDLFLACTGPVTVDQENCDFDSVFMMRENSSVVPEQGSASMVQGASFYDDFADTQQSVPVELWLQNLVSSDTSLTFASRVGIGTEDPDEKVHIVGDLRANNIMSDSICNSNMTECFDPVIIAGIAGSQPQMNCVDRPVVNIGNSQVYCAAAVDPSGLTIGSGMAFEFPLGSSFFQPTDCADTAQLMTGIDTNGDPICADP